MATKDLQYYLELPYTSIVKKSENGDYWVARVLELPHCMTHGDTEIEAVEDLEDAKRIWLESNLERGLPIPEPVKYTGQYHLRMAPSLHEKLALLAQHEGVSLNQYLNTKLAQAAGENSRDRELVKC